MATLADLSVDQGQLVAGLASRGEPARRAGLPGVCRWRRDRFAAARGALVEAGWVDSDRLGTMTLAPAAGRRRPAAELEYLSNEMDLEDFAEEAVCNLALSNLADEDAFRVVKTARLGRADTGGKWTRPDISLLAVSPHEWFPDVHLSTFEIKLGIQLRVDAVHEALAHRARAHFSWIVTERAAATTAPGSPAFATRRRLTASA